MGHEGVTALAEHEQTIGALANSNHLAHTRLDGLDEAHARDVKNLGTAFDNITEVRRDLYNFTAQTFWGRLRWLVTGR